MRRTPAFVSIALAVIALAAPAYAEAPLFSEKPAVAWERSVGGPGADRISALALLPNGAVAVAGARHAGGEDEGDAWIAAIDDTGETRWSHRMGGAGDQAFTALAALEHGVAAVGEEGRVGSAIVAAFDGAGQLLWRGTDALLRGDAALSAGGALALVGAVREKSGVKGLAVGLAPASGVGRWRHTDAAENNSVYLAAGPSGADILVTGWAEMGGDIVYKRPILLRLAGGDGALRWRRALGAAGEEGAFHALAPRSDGGAVLAGLVILSTGHPQPRAMAVNADGDFVWEFRPGKRQGTAHAAVALPDGGAILGGHLVEGSRLSRRAWLARIDAEGNVMWEKTWDAAGDAAIEALALGPDGTLTAAGSRLTGERGEDGWILQLR